jgi:hypothetical protein
VHETPPLHLHDSTKRGECDASRTRSERTISATRTEFRRPAQRSDLAAGGATDDAAHVKDS